MGRYGQTQTRSQTPQTYHRPSLSPSGQPPPPTLYLPFSYALVRSLRSELRAARLQSAWLSCSGSKPALSAAQSDNAEITPDDVTFEPIDVCSLPAHTIRRPSLHHLHHYIIPSLYLSPSRIDPPDITPFVPPDSTKKQPALLRAV